MHGRLCVVYLFVIEHIELILNATSDFPWIVRVAVHAG